MADINDIVDRQREELAARDKRLLDQISTDYAKVINRVGSDLADLNDKIRKAQEAGEDFSPSWLFRRSRLEDILDQSRAEFNRFSRAATEATSKEQAVQLDMSEFHFFEVTKAQLKIPGGAEALTSAGVTFNRLPTRAVEGLVARSSDGSPLKDLFDKLGPSFGVQLRDELIQAIAIGQDPRTTSRRIRELLAGNEARAQLIARTESTQAYREGAHLTSLENDSVLAGWTWITALDGRACAACVALNGTIHLVSERMACHPACRCTKQFNTKTWAELGIGGIGETKPPPIETGPVWFRKSSPEVQDLILGKAGGKAYRNYDVHLADFVGLRSDARWGRSYFQRAFKDAIKGPQDGVKLIYTRGGTTPPLPPPPKPPPEPPPPAPVAAAPPAINPMTGEPQMLSAAEARAKLEEVAKKFDAETDVISANRIGLKEAQFERLMRGEITQADYDAFEKTWSEEQSKYVASKVRERKQLLRDVLKVPNPIELEVRYDLKYTGLLDTPEALKAIADNEAAIRKGVEDFRMFVRDDLRPRGEKPDRFAPVDPVLGPGARPKVGKNLVRVEGDNTGRASQSDDHIRISFGDGGHVVTHELGHWLEEWRPDVHDSIVEFYEKRTAGESFKKLADMFPGVGYRQNEIVKVDKWIEPYMGKWYSDNSINPAASTKQVATEILSYGLELFHKDPMRLAKADPEYFDFIFELVRGWR